MGVGVNKQKGKRFGLVTTLSIALVAILWIGLATGIAFGVRDGTLAAMWTELRDGQAQIVASGIAALGLMTSALLVPFLFKDRIRDLDSAVGEMQKTLSDFERDAGERIEKLSGLLNERMEEIERRGSEDVDRLGEVLEEIRSAVILSLSEGQISDPKHAKVFAQHLYNDAATALARRVDDKPYLWEKTKAHIRSLKTMSPLHLEKLVECEILTSAERGLMERIKVFYHRRLPFGMAEIGELNKARSEFDRAFSEGAAQPVLAK